MQFSVSDVHIRYEDERTNPNRPFAMGITLEHLSAVSANDNWIPTFLNSDHTIIHKLITLKNLAVYWNPDEQLEPYDTTKSVSDRLSEMVTIFHYNSTNEKHRSLEKLLLKLNIITY